MIGEKQIRIGARMLELREQMRDLLGDKYAGHVADLRIVIDATMEAHGLSVLAAVTKLAKELDPVEQRTSVVVPLLAATAVEMFEERAGD